MIVQNANYSALINMFSKIGHIGLSEKRDGRLRESVTGTVMIYSFIQKPSSQKAIELLQRMLWEGMNPISFEFLAF